jgi:ferrochelatase
VTPVGVLVMAYGSPSSPDDIEAYYTHIRRGRPPTPELLADLTARYAAIGGVSPLAERTRRQVAAIREALDRSAPGSFVVTAAFKHAAPFVEDGVDELAAAGAGAVVALVLAPHWSAMSVGEYLGRARAQAARHGLEVRGVESWHDEPAYIDFLVRAVADARARLPAASKVLFTAHSLPARILEQGDPYPAELRRTAELVARRAALPEWSGWAVCWQSAGRTPEPWIGPDVLEVITDLAAHYRAAGWDGTPRARGVLVCPAGFVSEHLEVLYDLDIEAARVAESAGLAFARTAVPDDDPGVMAALAGRVIEAAGVAAGA